MKEKCPQTKCVYNQMGGCQKCSVCGCEPNMVDDNCFKCWNCSHDEGLVRWDNEKAEKEEEKVKEMLKDVFKKLANEGKTETEKEEKKKEVCYVN